MRSAVLHCCNNSPILSFCLPLEILGIYVSCAERHKYIHRSQYTFPIRRVLSTIFRHLSKFTPDLYSGGPDLKCRPGGRISCLRFSCFVSHSRQISGEHLKIKPQPLPSTSFSIHYSLITPSFRSI